MYKILILFIVQNGFYYCIAHSCKTIIILDRFISLSSFPSTSKTRNSFKGNVHNIFELTTCHTRISQFQLDIYTTIATLKDLRGTLYEYCCSHDQTRRASGPHKNFTTKYFSLSALNNRCCYYYHHKLF